MTPTPEVSERARALREAVWALTGEEECLPTETLPDWCFTAHASCDCRETADTILRAIVTELGITQEMVDWQEPCCDVPMPGCCSRHDHAVHMVLATLLAAGGDDE